MDNKPKAKITIKTAIELKWSAIKVVQHYFPGKSVEECYFLLWDETCFPFSNEIMMEQIYELYINSLQLPAQS